MCRLVVVLQHKTFIYDLNSITILEEIETVPNTKGKILLLKLDSTKFFFYSKLFFFFWHTIFAANMLPNQVFVRLRLIQKGVIWLFRQAHPKDLL